MFTIKFNKEYMNKALIECDNVGEFKAIKDYLDLIKIKYSIIIVGRNSYCFYIFSCKYRIADLLKLNFKRNL